MENDNKLEITFQVNDISNKFLLKHWETVNTVTHIYNAIQDSEIYSNKPLPTDSLPFHINANRPSPTAKEQKETSLQWLFRKTLEDIITGLSLSLVEANRFVMLQEFAKNRPYPGGKEGFEKDKQKEERAIHKMSLPDLIKKIEITLDVELPYKVEILSINKVRNCLTHRDGIVEKKDFNDKDGKKLILKWKSFKFFIYKKDERIELNYEIRKQGILIKLNELEVEENNRIKEFQIKDQITIDLNEFNGISTTCAMFVWHIHDKIVQKLRS